MWYLIGIIANNGATRVFFPASHIGDIAPDDLFSIEGTIPAEGPAGTILVSKVDFDIQTMKQDRTNKPAEKDQ
jgi:hypothetical protein